MEPKFTKFAPSLAKNQVLCRLLGQILGFAVALSAVMTIFPLITGVFAKAFGPLAEAVEKIKSKMLQMNVKLIKEDGLLQLMME